MPPAKKSRNFESALARLDEITTLLESGEASLEDSIDLYSEGLEIARECHLKLEAADKKIKLVAKSTGLPVEEDFDEEGVDG